MDIYSISFPIYYIPSGFTIVNRDNILICKNKITFREYILDNKNIAGSTLGLRRLQIIASKSNHLPLLNLRRRTITNIVDLIKNKGSMYIDDSGFLFRYKKMGKTKVVCYKIDKKIVKEDSAKIVVFIKKINRFFELDNSPESFLSNFVKLLHFKGDYYLYDTSEVLQQDEIIRI
jgi:hypothetical protein